MVYVLALAAACTSALGGVLQRVGIESAPADAAMRLRLLTYAFRRRVWMIGMGCLLGTFVLQASALKVGDLAVVQVVATTELLFLIAILAVFFHRPLGWKEWCGGGAIVIGLGGFLALAAPASGKGIPGGHELGWVALVVAVCSGLLVVGARQGPRWWRAAALGAAAALLFAFNASLLKATTTLISEGWGHVFTQWEPYAVAVTGAVGFFLLQNSLHAGPIAASRATMVILNPLVSVVIGVTVFDERLRTGAGFAAAEAAALVVMFVGAVVLVRSPLVSGSGQEERLRPPPVRSPSR